MTNPLREFFESRQAKDNGIWKWTHYFDIYHRHLQKFRGKDVTMLEVGVLGGGSLDMWESYFEVAVDLPDNNTRIVYPKVAIHGLDKNHECLRYTRGNVHVHIGDQGDPSVWAELFKGPLAGGLDVVIDDGSHLAKDQRITHWETWRNINPGGVYICEDAERNWFTDIITNTAGALQPSDGFGKDVFGNLTLTPNKAQQEVAAIHFYPMVIVIEKVETTVSHFVAERRGGM